MTTETDIANMALDILKEAPISSFNDGRPVANWFKRNFATTRDGLLSEAEWNSCTKRTELAADASEPVFGWDYSYTLPSDCLRLIPLTVDGEAEGSPIDHVVENGVVLTDQRAPLRIRYIYRNENYTAWPAPLIEALSARLAGKLAHWMTGKASYAQIAKENQADAFKRAWLVDAIEGTTARAADAAYTEARY